MENLKRWECFKVIISYVIRGGPWDGSNSHRRRYCHMKAYAWDFEIAQLQISSKSTITCQNSEMAHFFRPETLRWLKIRSSQYIESSFCSNFELSQRFWSEKVSHLGVLTRDCRFWANLKLSHLKISCICLHVTILPSMTFWAISRIPAYMLDWRGGVELFF